MSASAPAPALVLRFPSNATAESRDLIAAALLDFEAAAVHELTDHEWRVFFRTREDRDRAAHALAPGCTTEAIEIEDEDWARKSQQDLKAIKVGALVVAPPWDLPETGALIVVIEPSTGFGTGHHATTRLCLHALQRIDLRGKGVLDVGTGSGVLAIAAAKLGAAAVTAVDHDPDAIAAALDNIHRNGVDVTLRVVDLERTPLERADVVLANLTGAMLQRAAATLAFLARGGWLIVSGLLEEEVEGVAKAFSAYASDSRLDLEAGWAAFTFVVRGDSSDR